MYNKVGCVVTPSGKRKKWGWETNLFFFFLFCFVLFIYLFFWPMLPTIKLTNGFSGSRIENQIKFPTSPLEGKLTYRDILSKALKYKSALWWRINILQQWLNRMFCFYGHCVLVLAQIYSRRYPWITIQLPYISETDYWCWCIIYILTPKGNSIHLVFGGTSNCRVARACARGHVVAVGMEGGGEGVKRYMSEHCGLNHRRRTDSEIKREDGGRQLR